jgi:hypothetical protein
VADYVHLIGAEDVKNAGYNMQAAAQQMSGAASSIYDTHARFLQHFEELVARIEAAAEKIAAAQEPRRG